MEHNDFTYDAASNLMLAYRTLCDLEKIAHQNGLPSVSMITEENGGEVVFFLSKMPCAPYAETVTHIDTEEESIFKQKIETFRAYWIKFMEEAKANNAARIAALKEELAKLEGRA